MTTSEKTISDKILNGIKQAIAEIEEFRVQMALGKLEAKDMYEEAKKKFGAYVHEAKQKASEMKEEFSADALKVKAALETLQVRLALGKAETKEVFEEQRKKILETLSELENFIRNQKVLNEYYSQLLLELDKFRIKLEILKLRYQLKELDAKETFEEKKKELLNYIDEMKKKILQHDTNAKFAHVQDELSQAFKHFRKAFSI